MKVYFFMGYIVREDSKGKGFFAPELFECLSKVEQRTTKTVPYCSITLDRFWIALDRLPALMPNLFWLQAQ